MALVEAAYLSASRFRSVGLDEIERREERTQEQRKRQDEPRQPPAGTQEPSPTKPPKWYRRLFARLEMSTEYPHLSQEMWNFTPRAQQVLALARKEADHFNHHFVGTEHLLLGLVRLGQGVAVDVLGRLGVSLDAVRVEVEKHIGTGPDQKVSGNIPYTPRVKKVLALAAKEAQALHHTYVGTEHILLGLLREGDGVAARILASLNVKVEETRRQILKELDPNFEG